MRSVLSPSKTSGRNMRFGELLISLALFVVLSAATAGVYTAYTRNAGKTFQTGSDAVHMLSVDRKIREAVSAITIPYWEDDGAYAVLEAERLLQAFAFDSEIRIVKINMMRNTGGHVCGFKVTWTFGGCEYSTESLFASVPILGGT